MSPAALASWILLGATAVVVIVAVAGPVRRAVAEGRRLARRIAALGDHPLLDSIAAAERDAARIADALERVEPLALRAEAALAQIRAFRLMPPALQALLTRLQIEVATFKREAAR